MPVRYIFRYQFCVAQPDPLTQLALQTTVREATFGAYQNALPGRWLVWHGKRLYGPTRYACEEHRGDLVAYLRTHYGSIGFHPWKRPPYPSSLASGDTERAWLIATHRHGAAVSPRTFGPACAGIAVHTGGYSRTSSIGSWRSRTGCGATREASDMLRSEPSAASAPSSPATTGVHVRLANSPAAAREARDAVHRHLGDRLDAGVLDDVLLVVSELVTNAIRHGHGDIGLRVALEGELVSGAVEDAGSGFARALPDRRLPASEGRGLDIVGRLAARWGIDPESGAVWFEMRI
jgi:anti-sigma regulatory factor (Ser/Thr protein kinase)